MEKSDDKRPTEPPTVIWPACGAFCDIFWWVRRRSDATPSTDPQPDSSSEKS